MEWDMRINNSNIKSLKYAKSDNRADYRWDDTLKGFGVRVYPTGQVAYVASYRNAAARKRIMVIGKPTEMSANHPPIIYCTIYKPVQPYAI